MKTGWNRAEESWTERNRAEQIGKERNRTEQNRTEETEWNRCKQDETEQRRVEQSWTEQNRAEQNGKEQNRTEQNKRNRMKQMKTGRKRAEAFEQNGTERNSTCFNWIKLSIWLEVESQRCLKNKTYIHSLNTGNYLPRKRLSEIKTAKKKVNGLCQSHRKKWLILGYVDCFCKLSWCTGIMQ